MKSASERRLLLVLLLSSLVPLLALGLLAAGLVHRAGIELERERREAHQTRVRSELPARCLDLAESVSTFLRGVSADLRGLGLVTPTPEAYADFSRTALAPVWATDVDGSKVRIWVPLYSEVEFLGADGAPRLTVRGGRARQEGSRAQPGGGDRPHLEQILSLPVGATWVGPASAHGHAAFDAFDGSLRFAAPVRSDAGVLEGIVSLVLDPVQLLQLVRDPEVPRLGEDVSGETLWTFFFDGLGEPLLYPTPLTALGEERTDLVATQLGLAASRVREGASGVMDPGGADAKLCLAYAPLFLDAGPSRTYQPVGGLLLLATTEPAGVLAGASPPAALFTRGTELRIGLLTLAATLGVALAAFLVARKMTQPLTRLRDKVRAAAPSPSGDSASDDVEEISRSFDSLSSQVARSAVRIRTTETRLREFIEMNPDGIAVMDDEGHLLHFNHSLCQILRRTPGELTALDPGELFSRPGDRERLLARLKDRGRLRNYEVDLLRGDGKVFPAVLTLRWAEHEGRPCIDAIVRDISDLVEGQRRDREKTEALFRVYGELSRAHQELRKAYDAVEEQVRQKTSELRAAYEALKASDEVKTDFLMKMSHELRTPLNCIIGYSEAMIEGLDGPMTVEQSVSLDRIAQSGRRLLRLIENLLDLSRLEVGRMELACSAMCLEDAVEEVLHQARTLVGDKPIRLEVGIEEPLPPIWADPDRVRQVLFNLVGNAAKFTRQGRVSIEARSAPQRMVEVRVSDTGPGIPPALVETIFDKFVQLPGEDRSGAGLGLAICKELLEGMGGTIRVESTIGEGTTFILRLPAAGPSAQLSLPLEPMG